MAQINSNCCKKRCTFFKKLIRNQYVRYYPKVKGQRIKIKAFKNSSKMVDIDKWCAGQKLKQIQPNLIELGKINQKSF